MLPASGERQHPLERRPRGREGERLVAGSDVPEDPARDERIGDRCDAMRASAAAGAAQDVVGERPLEELGPGVAVGGSVAGRGGVFPGRRRTPRDDAIAERGRRRQ